MNKRTVSMIHQLCDSKENSLEKLSEKFKVSQRTIRNDLNLINDFLKENSLGTVELMKGGVIRIPENFEKIQSLLSGGDFYEYKLSKEERKKLASAMLINAAGFLTLSAIADALYVSRATIIGDLDEIKKFIRKNHLEVLSHPNKGLRVEGKESDKRIFLMSLADGNPENLQQDMVQKQIHESEETECLLSKILHEQEHKHKSYLTDDSFAKIQLYLGIMIRRNCQGEYIEIRGRRGNSKYLMAEDVIRYVCQYCHVTSTEDEVQFLSELLVLARYMKQKDFDQNAVKSQVLTREFIEKVSEETGTDLNADYDLFENLSGHLEAICAQTAVSGTPNPIITELLRENMQIEQAVLKAFPLLCQFAGREIPETEAGYIAVHFCAAIERKKNKEISFHVIVACHAGIGTSHLLLERLKKHFNFQIIDIVSSHEAQSLEAGAADFIISTVPLKECKLRYIIVSPLFTDEDYIRVGKLVDSLRDSRNLPVREEKKQITAKGLISRLSPVIYERVPEQAEALMHELTQIISGYFQEPVRESEEWIPSLTQLLPASHIQLNVKCTDWKDAVRKSADFLLDNKYIEERYIDAMIHNVEENGPYIVISQGFAVPHEGSDQGSLRTGMNLIRLEAPVEFGDEDTDPVEFVCCLSAKDHKTHLKAFFHLVNLLRQEEFKKELRNSRTPENVATVIRRYEEHLEKEEDYR